jgi:Fe-S cluster biogenesis protein NfuA
MANSEPLGSDSASPVVVSVVEQFSQLIERDGARLEITKVEDLDLHVRFVGTDQDCEVCALSPTDLEQLIGDALEQRQSPIRRVHVHAGD